MRKWIFITSFLISFIVKAGPVVTDWDHWYAGVNLGPMFQSSTITAYQKNLIPTSLNYNITVYPASFFIGGQIGRLLRVNNIWLAGLELDLNSLNIHYDYTYFEKRRHHIEEFDQFKIRNQFFGTLRMRLGFDIGWSYLPYLTVGPSYNNMYLSYNNERNNFYSNWQAQVGIAAGVGVEYHWLDRINFRCEYLFNHMSGTTTITLPSIDNIYDSKGTASATNNASFVRFALNMLF